MAWAKLIMKKPEVKKCYPSFLGGGGGVAFHGVYSSYVIRYSMAVVDQKWGSFVKNVAGKRQRISWVYRMDGLYGGIQQTTENDQEKGG